MCTRLVAKQPQNPCIYIQDVCLMSHNDLHDKMYLNYGSKNKKLDYVCSKFLNWSEFRLNSKGNTVFTTARRILFLCIIWFTDNPSISSNNVDKSLDEGQEV